VAVAQTNPQLMADLITSWLEDDEAKRQRGKLQLSQRSS
jgi:hypothetical protein